MVTGGIYIYSFWVFEAIGGNMYILLLHLVYVLSMRVPDFIGQIEVLDIHCELN